MEDCVMTSRLSDFWIMNENTYDVIINEIRKKEVSSVHILLAIPLDVQVIFILLTLIARFSKMSQKL